MFMRGALRSVFWSFRTLLQHNLRNRCVVPNHAPNMGLKTLQ